MCPSGTCSGRALWAPGLQVQPSPVWHAGITILKPSTLESPTIRSLLASFIVAFFFCFLGVVFQWWEYSWGVIACCQNHLWKYPPCPPIVTSFPSLFPLDCHCLSLFSSKGRKFTPPAAAHPFSSTRWHCPVVLQIFPAHCSFPRWLPSPACGSLEKRPHTSLLWYTVYMSPQDPDG